MIEMMTTSITITSRIFEQIVEAILLGNCCQSFKIAPRFVNILNLISVIIEARRRLRSIDKLQIMIPRSVNHYLKMARVHARGMAF